MSATNKLTEDFATGFLAQSIERMIGYKTMADLAIRQLTDDELQTIPAAGSNSIAVIMQHMAGNMLSRWTNFLTEDGEKSWRNRDQEFEDQHERPGQRMAYWEKGWTCFINTLKSLQPADLERVITIRNEGLKAYDAILRQLMHYSSHVGQIVYVAKLLKAADWQPLTIPKNQSRQYNQAMGYDPSSDKAAGR